MAKINTVIGNQVYETIHNRIGGILAEELLHQHAISYNAFLAGIKVWKDRDIPFNDSELKNIQVNVLMSSGEYEMQTQQQHDGLYRFTIEVVGTHPGEGTTLGDTLAMNKVQSVMGKCRAILMSPIYTTLGFPKPLLWNRHVESIIFGKPIKQDTSHVCMGRLVLSVKATETVDFVQGVESYATRARVYLNNTEMGYMWDNVTGKIFDNFFDESFG